MSVALTLKSFPCQEKKFSSCTTKSKAKNSRRSAHARVSNLSINIYPSRTIFLSFFSFVCLVLFVWLARGAEVLLLVRRPAWRLFVHAEIGLVGLLLSFLFWFCTERSFPSFSPHFLSFASFAFLRLWRLLLLSLSSDLSERFPCGAISLSLSLAYLWTHVGSWKPGHARVRRRPVSAGKPSECR